MFFHFGMRRYPLFCIISIVLPAPDPPLLSLSIFFFSQSATTKSSVQTLVIC